MHCVRRSGRHLANMMLTNVNKRIVNLYCLFGKMADMKVSEGQMLNVSLNCKP